MCLFACASSHSYEQENSARPIILHYQKSSPQLSTIIHYNLKHDAENERLLLIWILITTSLGHKVDRLIVTYRMMYMHFCSNSISPNSRPAGSPISSHYSNCTVQVAHKIFYVTSLWKRWQSDLPGGSCFNIYTLDIHVKRYKLYIDFQDSLIYYQKISDPSILNKRRLV